MELYSYNKDELKNNLTIDQVSDLVAELGGEPQQKSDVLICKTICHCGGSHKMYYYDNTKLFRCFTDCGNSFDIFELVTKVKQREISKDFKLSNAISFTANYFGIQPNSIEQLSEITNLEDWKVLEGYGRIKEIDIAKKTAVLEEYDSTVYSHLPQPKIQPWINEGMTQTVLNNAGIKFNPKAYSIIIPHYDINNRLIGIRERTLIKENESRGKYRPAYLAGKMYNHALGFNLYNINHAAPAIKQYKKAIVFEGEKSCLLYRSYFGEENDISVAVCGSSFVNYQAQMLIDLGVEEIIVAFDKQFQEKGDQEFKKLTTNLTNMKYKYGNMVKISFMFDKTDILPYKASPIDTGLDNFLFLFYNRVTLY